MVNEEETVVFIKCLVSGPKVKMTTMKRTEDKRNGELSRKRKEEAVWIRNSGKGTSRVLWFVSI